MSSDFLKNVPAFIETQQRIFYETIAISTDIMESNLSIISRIALDAWQAHGHRIKFSDTDRVRLFSLAWGIVDQADLIRQIITAEGKQMDLATARAFAAEAEKARTMRNWMDHLPQRVMQYVGKKGTMPPAHGMLSFTMVAPEDAAASVGGPVVKYRVAVVMGSSAHRPTAAHGHPVPYDSFKVPLDHFVLSAFDEVLSLSRIVPLARDFSFDLASKVEAFAREKATVLAVSTGRSEEDLMKPAMSPAIFVMTATYNGEGTEVGGDG